MADEESVLVPEKPISVIKFTDHLSDYMDSFLEECDGDELKTPSEWFEELTEFFTST